ncbi:MAG: GxxExxY protein [Saprospiraceae bacterium]|nr:GxxExxY protein [Saprospiraceae bacterium]
MHENEIAYFIRGAIFKVYQILGPGLLESAYEAALNYELQNQGLATKCQLLLPVRYEGIPLDAGYRIDLLVNDKVILEIKSVEILQKVHHKQLLTYLKLSKKN